MSTLAKLAAGVGGAAVAGFGLSAGRSAWKSTVKNRGTILSFMMVLTVIAAAATLPFLGGRELVRGHKRSVLHALILTGIGSMLLILLGYGAGLLVDIWIQQFQGIGNQTTVPRYAIVAVITTSLTLLGIMIGLSQRGERLRQYAQERANEQFLTANGIRLSREKGATHVDADGNILRYEGMVDSKMVFFAVGRRNQRAYISINGSGAMQEYSGVVPIGTW